jgi:DNA-binding transcriptional ArsR family regulator
MSQASHAPALSQSQLEDIASLFKLLGEPMRLRILQTLCDHSRHVGEIVELAGATQPNVSKHLALLVLHGVLERKKNGQRVVYSLKNPLVTRLCELVCASLPPPDSSGTTEGILHPRLLLQPASTQ